MSLPVKDGGGNNVILVSTLIGGEHAVHHVMLGSNDGGTTMQVLKTLADGTVVISGAVTVTGVATELTLQSAATFLTSIDASLADITRAEDAIHASGSRGVVALSVRRDTPTPTATDGDYTAFISGPNGGLWVETIGGATSALQTTGNASLDSLDGGLADLHAKVPAAAALADNPANPTLSAIASYTMVFDGTNWDRWDRSVTMTGVGLPGDSAAASDTESTGLVGLTKRLLQRITAIIGVLPGALGQTNSAGSFPVVIANNQSAVPVSGTFFQGTQPVSLASLPALAPGTAGIGKLTANSGVVIGSVEIAAAQTLATVTTVGTVTNLAQMSGQAISMNAGAVDAGTQRIVLANGAAVVAGIDSASLYNGATAMTPKFATIAESTSGDRTIVAGVTGKRVRVISLRIKAAAASSAPVAYYWRSGVGGTAIDGGASNTIPLDKTGAAGSGGETLQEAKLGWFQTGVGEALVLNLSAAQAVTGSITYVEV